MADDDVSERYHDGTDWLFEFTRRLAQIAESFVAAEVAEDWQRQQSLVSLALATAVANLNKLPGVGEHMRPLEAMMLAYRGLEDGRTHPLFDVYGRSQGAPGLTEAQVMMQGRALAMVQMLKDCGWRGDDEAETKVAGFMAKSGAKGSRKKEPVSVGNIRTWQTTARPEVTAYRDSALATLRKSFSVAGHGWPPSKEEAAGFLKRLSESPQIKALHASASAPAGRPKK